MITRHLYVMVQNYRYCWARQNNCLPLSPHWKNVVRLKKPKQKKPKRCPNSGARSIEGAFNHIKATLQVVLTYPDYSKVFESYTDASSNWLGAVFTQDDCWTRLLRPSIWNLLWTAVQYYRALVVPVQHTDKVILFLDKYRSIPNFSQNSPVTQCNYSVTKLNY